MRVLWCGDAVVPSGFARCTHAVCDVLHKRGHDVSILGINYCGDPHPYPYDIYPCENRLDGGRDIYGVYRLPILMDRLKPDVVILLNDPWNVPGHLHTIDMEVEQPPIMAWLAVDAKNQRGEPLNELDHVAVWTDFAADELRKGGYDGAISVVPLGVSEQFRPGDKLTARKELFAPEYHDRFVFGVVGRNQARKRVDLSMQVFADFVEREGADDAVLFIQSAPTGDGQCDVRSLVDYFGLNGKVLLSSPGPMDGRPDRDMPKVYHAMDVYMTTTQGEGWGLPALEAMACGVPCIVPDWSGLGSWISDGAALKVPCSGTALNAPLNGSAYTVGGVVDKDAMVWAMQLLYRQKNQRDALIKEGLKLSARLPWRRSAESMADVVESVARGGVDTEEMEGAV